MNRSLKIKVCGLLHPLNVEQVCALEPDFVGYIFYPGSKRYVGEKPDPAIFRIPTKRTGKVGVFVNEEISRLKQIFTLYQLDLAQLHGTESPRYCQNLRDAGISVIKALKPADDPIGGSYEMYKDFVHYFLFDTPGKELGGTGRKFDWDLLNRESISSPFLLSGGIGPGDATAIKEIEHEALIGVDVNSRFELSPGRKDVNLLDRFIKEIRA
jgi:phosphoribosylanthranilate isomerase